VGRESGRKNDFQPFIRKNIKFVRWVVARNKQTQGFEGDLFGLTLWGRNRSRKIESIYQLYFHPSHLKLCHLNCSRYISILHHFRFIFFQSWSRKNVLFCYTCLISFVWQTETRSVVVDFQLTCVLLLINKLWKNFYQLCSISFSCLLLLPLSFIFLRVIVIWTK
jgi:hypothetical protein